MSTSKALSETTAKADKEKLATLEKLKAQLAAKGWELTDKMTQEGTLQIIAKKAVKA